MYSGSEIPTSKLYILTDKDVLNKTLKKIREALNYARQHRPKENGITLKDKSLLPKKIKIKRLGGTCNMAKRKKNYYKKRVGSAADAWNAKVIVVEDEANKKRKRYKSNIAQMMKRNKLEDCDVDGH